MGDHVDAEIATPGCQRAVKKAEGSNDDNILPALITVGHAKNDPLQNDGDRDAAGESVELLLEVATESDLFTEAGSEANNNPETDFDRRFGEQVIDGCCCAAGIEHVEQVMDAIGDSFRQGPERNRDRYISEDVFGRGPAAC